MSVTREHTTIVIKSVQDGVTLKLSNPEWDEAEHTLAYFVATIEASDHSGTVRVYAFIAQGIVEFFDFLALNWKGWSGTREWSALEGELSFTATSDTLGHTFLEVGLAGRSHGTEWRLQTAVALEANQLEYLARQIRHLYYTKPTTV